jgi:tetratricopeptide (TPR) repeat protein
LLTYPEAHERAALIAAAAEARRMPPWLPAPGFAEFAGERRLSPEQIGLIRQWVAAGAPEGDPVSLPLPPEFPDGWQLGEPDLVVEFPTYTVPATGTDIYRNLVASIPATYVRYVNAVELRPGSARVHHARLMVDTTASSRERDARDGEPGFDGMDVMSRATSPDGFFVGWTPGKVPAPGPEDMAWRVRPGTDLVLQLHLRPNGQPEVVRAMVGLHWAQRPPTRLPALILFNWKAIDIPPGQSDYLVSDSFALPVDVEALGVYPHAHYLARDMRAFARLPDGSTRWLLRIPEWDFNWQDEYRYAAPIPLPRGSTLIMRYRYDNSAGNPRNPNRPPTRVTYGPRSIDEMGDLVIQVLPHSAEDLALLNRSLAWKYQSQDAEWLAAKEVARGDVLAARGEYAEAVHHFRAALDNREDARVHAELAGALASQGDFAPALAHAQAALHLELQSPLALAAMARILSQHPDPAVRNVKQAQRLIGQAERKADHNDPIALDALAAAYAALGAGDRAVRAAQRAVARASETGNDDLTAALRSRLEHYRGMPPH